MYIFISVCMFVVREKYLVVNYYYRYVYYIIIFFITLKFPNEFLCGVCDGGDNNRCL